MLVVPRLRWPLFDPRDRVRLAEDSEREDSYKDPALYPTQTTLPVYANIHVLEVEMCCSSFHAPFLRGCGLALTFAGVPVDWIVKRVSRVDQSGPEGGYSCHYVATA